MLLLLALACARTDTIETGPFTLDLHDDGTFTVSHPSGAGLERVRLLAGDGEGTVEMQFGSFRVLDASVELVQSGDFGKVLGRSGPIYSVEIADPSGSRLGDLNLQALGDLLILDFVPAVAHDRVGFSAACEADEHFLGLGGHQHEGLDHMGEAFPLWVSEPGIGKSDSDELPAGWPIEGALHATSFPVPFLLRPQQPSGLLFDTNGRVDVDLCASDAERFELVAWDEGPAYLRLFAGGTARGTIQSLTALTGRPSLPPAWVFGPWTDAIRGPDRVREVVERLQAFDVPYTAIWTEDWKGASESAVGYHLEAEWFLDEELYPDAEALASELEDDGTKWLAYFAPFVEAGTETWDSAVEAGVLVQDEEGAPYVFQGVRLTDTALVDLSTSTGREWAQGWMSDALALGFDGWMADYAEWLPADAVLANGMTGLEAHNQYPQWWQETNAELLANVDATFFVRSGWTRTAGMVPVVWGGDQRTSFDTDDGFPTVVPLGLGLAASGVPIFTHDVAGYQSVGNPPSTEELWWRWAALGAFSPILRTHHGAYDTDNWQFDSNDATTEHFARMAQEHVRLFPYRYGLAARAADEGLPMVQPVAFLYGEDWDRSDAWLLGDALLVAPVVEAGAEGRDVELPGEVAWWDWWTLQPASSGWHDAPLDAIPVFAAAGTTVPTLAEIPDTLVDGAIDRTTLAEVDGARVVYLFGGGGAFTEADGTSYAPSGAPDGSGETTVTLTEGTVEVAGVTVEVSGPVERSYTFVVP